MLRLDREQPNSVKQISFKKKKKFKYDKKVTKTTKNDNKEEPNVKKVTSNNDNMKFQIPNR